MFSFDLIGSSQNFRALLEDVKKLLQPTSPS